MVRHEDTFRSLRQGWRAGMMPSRVVMHTDAGGHQLHGRVDWPDGGSEERGDGFVVPVLPGVRPLVAKWWAIMASGAQIELDGEILQPDLLLLQSNIVHADEQVTIYRHQGRGEIVWIDRQGIYAIETLPQARGDSFAVVSSSMLNLWDEHMQGRVREWIMSSPPGTWALPDDAKDSTSLDGKLAITDCLTAYRPAVESVAEWVRMILPRFKAGVSSLEDVRTKLELERRLRVEEGVTGSLRPLALTLQAIEDDTFAWPGLWMVTGSQADIRKDLPLLLVWDAVLHAVAAATRVHAEFKPGLCYGTATSGTLIARERRFSKRDAGIVDSVYVQVNPKPMNGQASVVAGRLLQAATHEIAHLVLADIAAHREAFTSRREALLATALELLPDVTMLVEMAGLHRRLFRSVPVPPMAPDEWLREILTKASVRSVEQVVRSWGAVRNLTAGRAEREVMALLQQAERDGLCRKSPDGTLIFSDLNRP